MFSSDPPSIWPGDEPNPYAAPEVRPRAPSMDIEAEPGDIDLEEAEAIRSEHIGHEVNLKALGLLAMLLGAIYAVIGLGMLGVGLTTVFNLGIVDRDQAVELMTFGPLSFGFGALPLLIGSGLRRLKNWARWMAAIPTILFMLSTFAFVAVTALDEPTYFLGPTIGALLYLALFGYILHLLIAPKAGVICSPEYQEIIAQTRHMRGPLSCLVWGALLLLVLIVLGVVFSALTAW